MIDLNIKYPITPHPTWDIWDSTKLIEYSRCPRESLFRRLFAWEPDVINYDLGFGKAWHKGLDALYRTGFNKEGILKATEAFVLSYNQEFRSSILCGLEVPGLKSSKTLEQGILGILTYTRQYEYQPLRFLEKEIPGQVLINLNPIRILHFRLDTLTLNQDNKVTGLEHKTTGSSNPIYDSHTLSIQLGTYLHALYSYFDKDHVWGLYIDKSYFKTKDVEHYRIPFRLSDTMLNVWLIKVNMLLDTIVRDFELFSQSSFDDNVLKAFMIRPEGCVRYFKLCPFYDFCISESNPLKIYNPDEAPSGFKFNFWDPSIQEQDDNIN